MSYNDSYGPEPRPAGRRATREPAGPAKIQGSTAAAILVFIAIVGFGVGALIGNSRGDGGTDGTTADDSAGAQPGSAEEGTADPDDTEGADPTEDAASSVEVTLEMDDSAVANEELEYRVRTEPPQPGLVLGVERRTPGGDWEPFGQDQVQAELDEDGEDEGYVVTGVTGEAEWRVVGEIDGQPVESNVVTTTITEEDGDNGGDGDDEDDG